MLIKDIQLWVMLRAKGRVCGLRERGFQTLDFFADAITAAQLGGSGGGGVSPALLPFFENQKKGPDFGKKIP